jgi:cell division ATPase FtsA
VEYVTGIHTRIGYPNEHLAGQADGAELSSPIYATAVGLLMKGLESKIEFPMVANPELESIDDAAFAPLTAGAPAANAAAAAFGASAKGVEHAPTDAGTEVPESEAAPSNELETDDASASNSMPQKRQNFFESWVQKFVKFIDEE